MKATLFEYTGKGQADPAHYAAGILVYVKNTRLTQSYDNWEKVMDTPPPLMYQKLTDIVMTIRSSWEFVDYAWQIEEITLACCQQLNRSRHASFAQQAMRVADMSDFKTLCPATVKAAGMEEVWERCMDNNRATYKILRDAGIPAQDARGVVTQSTLTNIATKRSLREFSQLCGKRINLRAQGEYTDVVVEMKGGLLEVHPWAKEFLEPERNRTPALDTILEKELGNNSPVDMPLINDALKELDMLKGTWD